MESAAGGLSSRMLTVDLLVSLWHTRAKSKGTFVKRASVGELKICNFALLSAALSSAAQRCANATVFEPRSQALGLNIRASKLKSHLLSAIGCVLVSRNTYRKHDSYTL
eukprot:6184868-Pleurochrysis_carterae.AAC.4